jgi:GT2 family glycosyltransferase
MAESDASIGAVQSLVRLWKTPEKINATGGMVHFLGFGFVRDNGRTMTQEDVAPLDGGDIAYASGAAVLYRSSVLREVGLLDPYYFMYHEDLELGWRIRLAGYRNVLAARSVAEHNYEFKRSVQKFFWMERNRWIVHLGLLRPWSMVVLLPWMLGLEMALLLFAIKGGWIREKLLVYRDLLRPATWKHVRAKRRTIAALRRVQDREIVRHWTARIAHQEVANPIVEYVANPMLMAMWFILRPFMR